MNVLIITFSYPPHNSPRAFRWSSIAEKWATQGYHVDVISAWHQGSKYNELLNGIHVHRVGRSPVEYLKGVLLKHDAPTPGKPGTTGRPDVIAARSTVTGIARWIYDRSWKKVYWPDYACLWYFPALKMAKVLTGERKYDSIITVSLPFTAHAIGYTLHKSLNMNWLVDVGDPFCFMKDTPANNYQLYERLNHSFEKKIFDLASAISVTTEPTAEIYGKLFPDSAEKIHVIPPLLSLNNRMFDTEHTISPRGKIKFAFFGTLHRTIRNADFLLRIYKKLIDSELSEKIELHLYGRIEECQESFLPYSDLMGKKLFLHGVIPKDKTIEAMREADILINIGNETTYQLPSKVVEYASTGKPILNLVKNSSDSSVKFFREYPACFNLFAENRSEPDLEQLAELVHFIEAPPAIEAAYLNDWLSMYRTDAIAKAYEKLLRI